MSDVVLARRASRLSTAPWTPAPPETISLDSGHAFPGLLPDLSAEADRALSEYRGQTLQYGPKPGIPELRSWIAEYSAADGVNVAHDNVLMTNGAKQAIELVCRLLLDEGDSIVVTAPTYFTAIPIFKSFGVSLLEVGQDDEGIDIDQVEKLFVQLQREGRARPKFIYDVPDYHNPTGITMSLERRKALVDLAVRERVFVVEDSPYRKITFEGPSVTSLKSLDPEDRVFQIGTFSKLMAPGIRVGWVSSSADMIARLIQLKADSGSSPLNQRVVFEFCAAGKLREHTERVIATYRVHRDRIVGALRKEIPEIAMNVPGGGYYIWLTLPPAMDGDALAARAAKAGVGVLPASKFYASPGHAKNNIRVAFTHASLDEIDEGIHRLATAFRSLPAER